MGVGLDIDLRPMLRQLTDGLDEARLKLVPKAKAIALSRVGVTLRKEASTKIREKLAIKAALAKSGLSIIKGKGFVILRAKGKPIALREFGAKQRAKGVSYKISKARGRRLYTNKYGASFQIKRFGNNVFIRKEPDPKGPQKGRIRKVYGPSLEQYFSTKIVQGSLETIARRFPIEFERALRGLGLKASRVLPGS